LLAETDTLERAKTKGGISADAGNGRQFLGCERQGDIVEA